MLKIVHLTCFKRNNQQNSSKSKFWSTIVLVYSLDFCSIIYFFLWRLEFCVVTQTGSCQKQLKTAEQDYSNNFSCDSYVSIFASDVEASFLEDYKAEDIFKTCICFKGFLSFERWNWKKCLKTSFCFLNKLQMDIPGFGISLICLFIFRWIPKMLVEAGLQNWRGRYRTFGRMSSKTAEFLLMPVSKSDYSVIVSEDVAIVL